MVLMSSDTEVSGSVGDTDASVQPMLLWTAVATFSPHGTCFPNFRSAYFVNDMFSPLGIPYNLHATSGLKSSQRGEASKDFPLRDWVAVLHGQSRAFLSGEGAYCVALQ